MDSTVLRPEANAVLAPSKRPSLAILAGLLGFFLALDLVTVPGLTGDTLVYVGHILSYAQAGASASPSLLWEFGHLLWRPLGYVLWQVTRPLTASLYGGNPVIEVTAVLFAVNFVSGVALTFLTFGISRRLGLEAWPAFTVTLGIVLGNAFVNYVHSGCSYVPGLALHVAGFWLILKAIQDQRHSRLYAVGAGVALALACAIWFPYILGIPAALLAGLVVKSSYDSATSWEARPRIGVLAITVITTAAFGVGIFLTGALLCHVSSLAGLSQWMIQSGHGIHAERQFTRFPTGITRTFIYLGDEGTTIKRFVFGDPYAPVRRIDLLGVGLWKVALAFFTFFVLIWSLLKTRETHAALAVTLTGVLPNVAFALFIFDTGSPERFLPLCAALIFGVCAVVRRKAQARAACLVLGIFLLAMTLVNLKAYAWDLRNSAHASSERAQLVHAHTRQGGVALILSFKDPISTYFQRSPFDPQNQPNALPLYHVTEPENGDMATWKSQSSCRILKAWDSGGEAWMSKRLVAGRPQPDWQWVENDVPNFHWTDVSRFFTQLEANADIGGSDGFLRIARTANDQTLLQSACAAPLLNR